MLPTICVSWLPMINVQLYLPYYIVDYLGTTAIKGKFYQ